MRLGIPVPQIYIVPAERFCRDIGPALGVNLAEFEFPGYFNFFVRQKTCTLVVDSQDAEDNIRRVFEETLLGPNKFRREDNPMAYDEQDFAPDFPKDAIPDLQKELAHFRDFGGKELSVEMILNFCHFLQPDDGCCHDNLGVPPNLDVINDDEVDDLVQQDYDEAVDEFEDEEKEGEHGAEKKEVQKHEDDIKREKTKSNWSYGRARWVGKSRQCDSSEIRTRTQACPLTRFLWNIAIILLSQVTLQQYGHQMLPKNRRRTAPRQGWRFSKCPVEQSILFMMLMNTTS